ncbi:MAG: T9SS type A sorting domain-containing protein, partial [Bacteroidota bacterium]|nr:T9SS type A sorting domain-containing protein [Bacteroidota bacterium]MDX5429784.1 T9SS type A sorting domain-containing protein [Bacteroidota bacterium]MDX5468563.1 T9SS type A sorting domain-containing protein [Bacteroidota bacterium]
SRTIKIGERSKPLLGRQYLYAKDSFYQVDGISDTVACFYQYKNGTYDPFEEPLMLGKKYGWVYLDIYERLQQYSLIVNGVAQNMPSLTWHSFYPERAGDMKQWAYNYPWNYTGTRTKGYIDSFTQVLIYPDSIIHIIDRWTWEEDNTWSGPIAYKIPISAPQELKMALDSTNMGACLNFYSQWGDVRHFYLSPRDMGAWYRFVSEGRGYYIQDSNHCSIGQAFDIAYFDEWNTVFGRIVDASNRNYIPGETLVAARIGVNKYKDIQVMGIERAGIHALQVYPNPTSESVILSEEFRGFEYTLYDMQGRKMYLGIVDAPALSVAKLDAGIYILNLRSAGHLWSARLQILPH